MVYIEVVMIVKEYKQNINTKLPKNYFERWYADMWHRRIDAYAVMPDVLTPILTEELAKIGATFTHKDNGYRFVVTFWHDADYTWFVMRWS
jgi:hypothetical protein